MPKVHFVNEALTVDVPRGASLRDVAIQQGIELYRGMWTHINCRGNGICGRCRVWLLSSAATTSSPSLRERLVHRVIGKMRLACQVKIVGDLDIRTRPIGPTVVERKDLAPQASYKAEAEKRLAEARAAEKKEAEKKAKEAAAKAAEAKAAEAKAAEAKAAEAQASAERPAPASVVLEEPAAAATTPPKTAQEA